MPYDSDLPIHDQILSILPGAELWFVKQALQKSHPPRAHFASFEAALSAYRAIPKERIDREYRDSLRRALIELASTFDEAWTAHQLTDRDSITRGLAFSKAAEVANDVGQLQILFYNCDRSSILEADVILRLATLLTNPGSDS
ncbi:hypothetical protein K2Q16_01995 [Patescibacteria group bacterium]|nr:hypothetical protein [Patescibacteria group bacterium]